jgi:L-cysteine S-thiosulfotransferase
MRALTTGVVLLAAAAAACVTTPRSSAGFRLPEGDVQKGRVVFSELRCNACHQVAGAGLVAPTADPPVAVTLGGVVDAYRTDGELVTAIINPSHRVPREYAAAVVRSGTLSRMGDFSEAMTVRQLADLVAFLQSRYDVQPPVPVTP